MSRPPRAVFRLPGAALLIPFLLFVCVTPLATVGAKFWLALYVLPVIGLAYVLLTRTVADAQAIRTTGLLGGRRINWADLDGLEFHGPRWAIAVATSGRRFRLPMIRPRDLPRLAQVSGGRLLLGRDAPAPAPDEPVSEGEAAERPEVDLERVDAERVDAERADVERVDIERAEVERANAERANAEPADAPPAAALVKTADASSPDE